MRVDDVAGYDWLALSLGIAEQDVHSDAFAAFFSGDAAVVPGRAWQIFHAMSSAS